MVNRVVLVGRLTADPELRYTGSGTPVANFRLAVDRPFTNAAGERETDFINIVAWRQRAEFAANYLAKGRLVAVDGRLQIRQWTTQDGQRRQTAEVVSDQLTGLDRPREREDFGGGPPEGDEAPSDEAPSDEDSGGGDTDVPDPFENE
jgi:single-strand DNA-binding protein